MTTTKALKLLTESENRQLYFLCLSSCDVLWEYGVISTFEKERITRRAKRAYAEKSNTEVG